MSQNERLSWLADLVGKMLSAQRSLLRLGENDSVYNEVVRGYEQELEYLRKLRSEGKLK